MKPSKPTSVPARQLTLRGAATELSRRTAAAPAFSRWIFIIVRTDDTALRRHILLRTVRQSTASKKNLCRPSVFAGVHFRRSGRSARQCVHLREHISGIPMYKCVYLSRTLRKTRDLSQTRFGYMRLSSDLVETTPLDPRLGIGSASSRSEVKE